MTLTIRAVVFGSIAGAAVGAAIGFLAGSQVDMSVGVLGIAFGGIYGGGVGVVCGALNGAVLAVVLARRVRSAWVAPTITGLVSAAVGVGLIAAEETDGPPGWPVRLWIGAAFLLTGVVGGWVVTRRGARD
ncbi:hypothetical protein SAMN04515671_2016 [Nakamurella panacisegetis]|uniref:Uncharacterized protein n=1 Tax=Nakamurella panacisegetis TaxID=1090615 RepID=A0A1H0MHQ5_9ACTN|nr:hypothetical protein [Nakamurella panacisegetis]SDO79855.1 hypothetical protein SAMN04515671_2016 [Nakamurella panacisegetis]